MPPPAPWHQPPAPWHQPPAPSHQPPAQRDRPPHPTTCPPPQSSLQKPLEQPNDLPRLLDMSIVSRTRNFMRHLTMRLQLGVAHHRITLATRKYQARPRTGHKTVK